MFFLHNHSIIFISYFSRISLSESRVTISSYMWLLQSPCSLGVSFSLIIPELLIVSFPLSIFDIDLFERSIFHSPWSHSSLSLSGCLSWFLYVLLILVVVSKDKVRFYWYDEFKGRELTDTLWLTLYFTPGFIFEVAFYNGYAGFFTFDGVKLIWYELSNKFRLSFFWFLLILTGFFYFESSLNIRWITTAKDCCASLFISIKGS